MILIDSGPLIALCDRADAYHAAVVAAAAGLPAVRRVTSWSCVTEAMYLLGRRTGFAGQHQLWELIRTGRLDVRNPTANEVKRMRVLMDRYRDVPMDLAEASASTPSTTCSATPCRSIHAVPSGCCSTEQTPTPPMPIRKCR